MNLFVGNQLIESLVIERVVVLQVLDEERVEREIRRRIDTGDMCVVLMANEKLPVKANKLHCLIKECICS
jgi:hypothetical protein